jgi:K+-sensing histidine kinase KdpD
LAEEDAPSLSAADEKNLIKLALRGARRLQEEIEDILRYLNVSKMTQVDRGCQLSELASIVAEISRDLGLSSVTLSGLESLEQMQLSLSRQAIEWILWEILENAKKFHPQQTPGVELFVTSCFGGKAISLKISDDGLILSPEQLAQVWMPYYQGEKFFTGEAAGMGLGLSTVASLVWEVDGTCRLHNRDNGPGVVVELVIPTAQE